MFEFEYGVWYDYNKDDKNLKQFLDNHPKEVLCYCLNDIGQEEYRVDEYWSVEKGKLYPGKYLGYLDGFQNDYKSVFKTKSICFFNESTDTRPYIIDNFDGKINKDNHLEFNYYDTVDDKKYRASLKPLYLIKMNGPSFLNNYLVKFKVYILDKKFRKEIEEENIDIMVNLHCITNTNNTDLVINFINLTNHFTELSLPSKLNNKPFVESVKRCINKLK